jgi:hypothetical protein
MLAYDYPLLGIFWTIVFLGFWVLLLGLIFWAFADIIRNPHFGGLAKVLWIILVIIVPFIGIVAYVVAREHERSKADLYVG